MSSTRKFPKPDIAVLLIAIIVVIGGASYYYTTLHPSAPSTAPTTLIVDEASELQSLDPGFDYEYVGWEIIEDVYQTLGWWNGTGTTSFKGVLAESWTTSLDGLVSTFKLSQGVKFNNGDPFDASVVKYSIDRVLKMNQSPSWILAQDMDLNSVRVIDPYTVAINLTQPSTVCLDALSCAVASIVDAKGRGSSRGTITNSL